MAKFRVAGRDRIGGEELRRYAVRWVAFVGVAALVVIVALTLAR